MASTNIYTALSRLKQSESALTVNNRQLQELTQTLEQRIEDRTADLANATAVSQRRARQFEAIARVSSEISSARNLDELLPGITQAISEQFDFYHTGIFFNDPDNQFAVLVAANSEGGQRMLKREHKLRIGAQGIVGYVTGTGLPRVAQNVGDDSVYFNNPDLPNTLTEMALPLKVGGKTVGALDVQSTESFAIANEDIASLSILADQVSIAIENARLYETTRKSLEHTESAYRQYVQNEWARFVREEKLNGYHYSNGASHPLEAAQDLGDAARAVREGKIHQVEAGESGPAQLTVPVKMRGKVVGILHISQRKKSRWTDDDIDIAEAVADRLALSIENARLFQVTAARAARERIVSDFSSRISGNIRIDNILRTAAQELSQALNGSEVLIQLSKRESAAEVQE
jgi:GAF domain-containing protein